MVVGQNVDRQNVDRHNVEQSKCRIDKMSNRDNIEQTKCLLVGGKAPQQKKLFFKKLSIYRGWTT